MTTDAPQDRGHLLTEQRLDASSDLDSRSVEKTLRLINDQDATVAAIVRQAIPAIADLVETVVGAMRCGGRLIYLGAGTSGRLGVLDASECPPTFHCDRGRIIGIIAGGDTALRHSSEGAEDDVEGARGELERLGVGRHDVVIGIAAGGTTAYVLGGLNLAKRHGTAIGLICCVQCGMARASVPNGLDHLIELPVGPEVVTGSTRMKAGTATKLVLNMISTSTMVQLGKVWGNLMVDLRVTNSKLRDRAARMIMSQSAVSRDTALAFLDQCGGRVKPAMIMAKRGVIAAEAHRLLEVHGQTLRPIIGRPDP